MNQDKRKNLSIKNKSEVVNQNSKARAPVGNEDIEPKAQLDLFTDEIEEVGAQLDFDFESETSFDVSDDCGGC